MHNRKVWRSEKYNDFLISVKVPSVDVTDRLAVDSAYSARVFSLSSVGVGVGVDGSAVGMDVVVCVAFGLVEFRPSVEAFRIRTSQRTMFLK